MTPRSLRFGLRGQLFSIGQGLLYWAYHPSLVKVVQWRLRRAFVAASADALSRVASVGRGVRLLQTCKLFKS